MLHRYKAYNQPMNTTAAFVPVTTGTNVKTMLQIATPSTRKIQILEWGWFTDALPTSASKVELIDGDVAATVGTAHVAAGVQPLDPGLPASLMTLGTGATGFSFGTENSITASRLLDIDYIDDTPPGAQQRGGKVFNPATAPWVAVSRFLRLRVHFGSAVNMTCWIVWSE